MNNEDVDIAEIRRAVNTLREHSKLSQADVARLLGVPPKTLNDWLRNPPRTRCRHTVMLALALEALAKRLGIN